MATSLHGERKTDWKLVLSDSVFACFYTLSAPSPKSDRAGGTSTGSRVCWRPPVWPPATLSTPYFCHFPWNPFPLADPVLRLSCQFQGSEALFFPVQHASLFFSKLTGFGVKQSQCKNLLLWCNLTSHISSWASVYPLIKWGSCTVTHKVSRAPPPLKSLHSLQAVGTISSSLCLCNPYPLSHCWPGRATVRGLIVVERAPTEQAAQS
jgi:hypothetical protein